MYLWSKWYALTRISTNTFTQHSGFLCWLTNISSDFRLLTFGFRLLPSLFQRQAILSLKSPLPKLSPLLSGLVSPLHSDLFTPTSTKAPKLVILVTMPGIFMPGFNCCNSAGLHIHLSLSIYLCISSSFLSLLSRNWISLLATILNTGWEKNWKEKKNKIQLPGISR